ncbi:MAG: hypothetical protein ACFFBD_09115, partial [Candidatus Hodarchaeota archaeon]
QTQAQVYLTQLQKLHSRTPNKTIHLRSRLAEALILKASMRTRNRVKAEQLLMQVAEEDVIDYEITVEALLNICELFLTELQISNDPEVLNEIPNYLNRLQDIAQQQNSYWLLAETYWFQSKIALLNLDIREARRLLTQAQTIADKWGLRRLAIKISSDHDSLLEQLSKWDELKLRDAPLAERTKLARSKEFIEQVIRKKMAEIPVLPEEESIMLLILDKTGLTRFSKTFKSKSVVDDQLIGGFLSAIQSFSKHIFERTLDRIKLEKFTLLLKSEEPLQICYVLKGQTYTAQEKLARFIQRLRTTHPLWDTLTNPKNISRVLKASDQSLLEEMITQIFHS